MRLPLGGEGTFSAVIDPLLFASGTLHDLSRSTGLTVARNVTIALAIVFWLGLAYWVHRDARRRIGNPFLVSVATLLGLAPPYIGPLVYRLFRPAETIDDVRARDVPSSGLSSSSSRARNRPAPCAARR